jgi:hypothetical protein
VTTAAASVVAALLIGSDGGTSVTQTEWIGIVATTLLATVAVFAVPNKPADPSEPPLID